MTQGEAVVSHNALSLLLRTRPDTWRPGPRSRTHCGQEVLGGSEGLLVGRALEDAGAPADVTYVRSGISLPPSASGGTCFPGNGSCCGRGSTTTVEHISRVAAGPRLDFTGRMCHVSHVVGTAGPEREVKVPECALKEAVSRHHGEASLQEDLPELGADRDRACRWPCQGGRCGLRTCRA